MFSDQQILSCVHFKQRKPILRNTLSVRIVSDIRLKGRVDKGASERYEATKRFVTSFDPFNSAATGVNWLTNTMRHWFKCHLDYVPRQVLKW